MLLLKKSEVTLFEKCACNSHQHTLHAHDRPHVKRFLDLTVSQRHQTSLARSHSSSSTDAAEEGGKKQVEAGTKEDVVKTAQGTLDRLIVMGFAVSEVKGEHLEGLVLS